MNEVMLCVGILLLQIARVVVCVNRVVGIFVYSLFASIIALLFSLCTNLSSVLNMNIESVGGGSHPDWLSSRKIRNKMRGMQTHIPKFTTNHLPSSLPRIFIIFISWLDTEGHFTFTVILHNILWGNERNCTHLRKNNI